jgi:hypothetical protein
MTVQREREQQMAQTVFDRLGRVSDGYRIRLDKLKALKSELNGIYAKLADKLADLELAAEAFGEDADELLSEETAQADRGGYWEALMTDADNAIAALRAMQQLEIGT